MERRQLLKDDSKFGDYKIATRISAHHEGEREVYRAESCKTGEAVALTVFNLGCKRYATDASSRKRIPDFIEEVKFLKSCFNEGNVFARVLDCGISGKKPKRLAWMAQEWADCKNLTSELIMRTVLPKEDALKIMKALISGVVEIRNFTRGGGHYGISAENILLEYDGDDLKAVRLIGLSNIGTTCLGTVPFDRKEMDKRFLPCESAHGLFNHLTDVYALGMLMGWMFGGFPKYPETFDDEEINSSVHSSVELYNRYGRTIDSSDFRNWFATEVANKRFSGALRLTWLKATNPIPSDRFQSVEKFQYFIDKLSTGKLSFGSYAERTSGNSAHQKSRASFHHTGNGHADSPKELKGGENLGGLDEVAGMDDLKDLFRRNFIRIVRNPKIAKAYGITPCNCILLYGPQGCGKTFIAEKAAQESGLKYKIVNPSDLGSIYIHGSQEKIAETFREAEKNAPMILIFDEFDAIAPKRDVDLNPHQANEVNELLTQLNNCAEKGVYVLGTTNRPQNLDSAILRAGRTDLMFYVSLPDFKARREIFELELKKRPCADDIDLAELAKATENFTCSDLSFVVKESARRCFDKTIAAGASQPIPLSQSNILDVIKSSHSSVSEEEIKSYKELKDKMEHRDEKNHRPRVGFSAYS